MFTEITKRPALNSTHYCPHDKQTYKVVGFKTLDSGREGVEIVRYIKSRDDWAKTPVCRTYLNTRVEDGTTYDLFYEWFPEDSQDVQLLPNQESPHE